MTRLCLSGCSQSMVYVMFCGVLEVLCGVPQDGVLSPFLFSIYSSALSDIRLHCNILLTIWIDVKVKFVIYVLIFKKFWCVVRVMYLNFTLNLSMFNIISTLNKGFWLFWYTSALLYIEDWAIFEMFKWWISIFRWTMIKENIWKKERSSKGKQPTSNIWYVYTRGSH